MQIQAVDYLVHFSNVLLLVSYSVRDILWLRWFAVAAALTNMPYFLLQHTVLWPPVLWALVFTAINLYQISRIYLERRPVVLSDDEQRLYDLGFQSLRPREFVSLMLVGEWKSASAGERILIEGEPVSRLCVAITGRAEVRKQGQRIGTFEPGHLIGTALALMGASSPVEATFTEPSRYMSWPLSSLRTFVDKRPDLRVTLQGLVSRDLATKLGGLLS
jgi:CRP-like cAMP-binding protein